jgi:hypothetical protein
LPPSFYPYSHVLKLLRPSPFNIYWQLGGLLLSPQFLVSSDSPNPSFTFIKIFLSHVFNIT